MKRQIISCCVLFFCSWSLLAQTALMKGRVVEINSNQSVKGAILGIEGSNISVTTDENGLFNFSEFPLPLGEQILTVVATDFLPLRIPVTLEVGRTTNLNPILLQLDLNELASQIGVISLSDDELDQDDGAINNISGVLAANKDVFLNAAAYDFSAAFFRPRGLDNSQAKVLINGIEMNKQFNGRPQWANWGGLNDVQRNRDFTMGLQANDYTFGDIAGTTNISMRASLQRKGGQVSFASSNRSYRGRLMGTYNSGLTGSGWAYSVSVARRYAEEGYVEGTLYDANSFFVSVEKKLGKDQSLNLTAFYTPNRSGRGTPLTTEVNLLKGRQYNPNWGYQDGQIRNSRVREIRQPVILLNHYWDISEESMLNINAGYQFGTFSTSRIDNNGTRLEMSPDGQVFFTGGARNPLANYYQRLPSYFLRNPNPTAYDYQLAYQAQEQLIDDGQLNWAALYDANVDANGNALPATYVLQNDVTDDTQLSLNALFNSKVTDHCNISAAITFRNLKSQNYAEVVDLLGSSGYLDIDSFTEAASGEGFENLQLTRAQSDLQNPNRIAVQGDRYKYNYDVSSTSISGFAQGEFSYRAVDFFLALTGGQTTYQRTGIFENGNFPGTLSLGPGEQLSFTTYGIKGGLVYKLSGRHHFDINGGYFTKSPTLRSSFVNARQNNETVLGLDVETIQSTTMSYRFSSARIKARLTGFYTVLLNQTDIGFYFTENISGLGRDGDAFVQEVATGINSRRMGTELGFEVQCTATFKLKLAGSFGQYTFINNPQLYLRSDDFEGELSFGDGTARLKDYHVAAGPERAYQLGFEYRDPDYWWVGVTGNYFSNAYIDINHLARSANFTSDFDGQPFNDFREDEARALLQQEEVDPYVLVNLVGGKSWRIKKYYVGFFATINNALDQRYVTGGFEQGRNSNFRKIREDKSRPNGPLFGNRYFFGRGTTYYINAYVRF